ncbi:MAG: FAD-binding protein [Trueperaceae bacterium]|nr:MAG: FAD-binding protein [Trueperaceae bacterium]
MELETRAVENLDGLIRSLQERISGEIRFDKKARALYATDASPYEIEPLGVVLPKSVDDVRAVIELANRYGVPILPRGGGTSLAGQTVARALVLDFTKYMTDVLDFDPDRRLVKVQPGIVRDELNRFLAPHGLQFTPDVATTNRATVGGMVANNSAGTRSIKYGKSVDQVVAMTVLLSDGTVTELRELSADEFAAKVARNDLEGEIYQTIERIVREHEEEIETRYPKVMRRVGGYNLDEFTRGAPINLAKLVSGSEGTLAAILDVTLKLHPVPRHSCLALMHFDTLVKALTAVQYINRHGPSAVEIMDDHLFDLGKKNPHLAPLLTWLQGHPAAVLMVEFDGESEEEMLGGLNGLQGDPNLEQLSYHTHLAFAELEQQHVLEFRRGGLGIYATVRGEEKPTPFIEDAAIPVENLPYYVPEVLAICERHGVKAVLYAHASVGVIHIRPHLDLKTARGIELYQRISEEVFELVKKYGGSWSGEHGDGLIRSYQNENLFGPVLYQAFREIKRAFDPKGLMNPGKIVDAPAMTENLRYGVDYPRDTLQTIFDFSGEGGYLGAVEMCTGVGACRKVGAGTMCPSFMATRDEDHSTRGRANILREAINGRLPGGLTSREVFEVLDLCLECKACKAECPSQVDMAKLKYEFLHHYYRDHGTPLSVRAIGNVARVAPLAQRMAPLANAMLPLKPVRALIERTVAVDRRRVLPRYARESFASWAKNRPPSRSGSESTVALFADTWTTYHEPELGKAAVAVLENLGHRVEIVPYRCCGRPQISKGLLADARKLARQNVAALKPYVERGVPIIGLEPSCVTALQDDYRDLVPGEATASVADHTWMIDQFLAKEWARGKLDSGVFTKTDQPILLHGHCQQRAVIGISPTRAVLEWVSDQVEELDAGCCGMAGSFGYGHYDLSMQIGEQRLFPAVRRHPSTVVACGFSCRHQIRDGTEKHAKHVAEVLAGSLA